MSARSERDLERMGRKGPDTAPESPIDPKTGAPVGIDKGWDYNVGKAAWGENEAKVLMDQQGKWKDLVPWGPEKYGRPARIPVEPTNIKLGPIVEKGDIPALRELFRKTFGGDQAFIKDPKGEFTEISQAVIDHWAEDPRRFDGREAYFPFVRDLIEDPYEIWINFAQSEESGRVALRRRYVKAVRTHKDQVIGLYAEMEDGQWISGDLFRGKLTGAGNLRKGRMIYGRD